jgi:hypothetical protein
MYCDSMYKHTVVLSRTGSSTLLSSLRLLIQNTHVMTHHQQQQKRSTSFTLALVGPASLCVCVPYAPVTAFRVCIINHPENEEGRLVSPWRVELAVQTRNAETETTRGRDMRNTTDIVFANSSLA